MTDCVTEALCREGVLSDVTDSSNKTRHENVLICIYCTNKPNWEQTIKLKSNVITVSYFDFCVVRLELS